MAHIIDWASVTKDVKMFSLEGRVCVGKVVDVYDGDTVKIVFPLTDKEPDRLYKWNCRLINVDTPEIRTRNLKEKAFGKSVRDKLREKILNSLVKVRCEDFDKYGRLLAEIFTIPDNAGQNQEYSINEWLIENGYAKKYDGGTKTKWFVDE
jgi:endonuclease YncB( thermonuclease family)